MVDFSNRRSQRETELSLCRGEEQYSDNSTGLADRTPAHAGGSTLEITSRTYLKRVERYEITSRASVCGEKLGGDAR